MSEQMSALRRDVNRLNYLLWVARYIEEHRSDFGRSLNLKMQKERTSLPAEDVDSLASDALRFVTVAENILLWMFYEKYVRAIHEGHDATKEIKKKCPTYLLKCHRNHPESHILDIVKDLRDRTVHSRPKYNTVQCDRSPEEILLQAVLVRKTDIGEEVLLMHDLSRNEQLEYIEKRANSRQASIIRDFWRASYFNTRVLHPRV